MRYYTLFRVVLFLCLFTFIIPLNSWGQFPDLIIKVPDTLVHTGQNEAVLSIEMNNFNYEIFGFQMVLLSNRPDLVTFTGIDTTGTLTSGFEYVEAVDRAGDQSELWFRCIADLLTDFDFRDGILPNTSGVVVKVKYKTTNAPDTLLDLKSLITYLKPVDFSDKYGNSLGAISEMTTRDLYYICNTYSGDSCISFYRTYTPGLGYDFMVVDTLYPGDIDPYFADMITGSIQLGILNCDQDGNGQWDISDLVCLIDFMFNSYNSEACPLLSCEIDQNQGLDIADVVGFIDYFFNDGPPPPQ